MADRKVHINSHFSSLYCKESVFVCAGISEKQVDLTGKKNITNILIEFSPALFLCVQEPTAIYLLVFLKNTLILLECG